MDTRLLTDHREESGIEKTPPPRTIRDDVRDNSTSTKVTSPADRAIKYRAVLPKATESRRGNINLSGVLRSKRAAAISPRTIVLSRVSAHLALSLLLFLSFALVIILLLPRSRALFRNAMLGSARASTSERLPEWKSTRMRAVHHRSARCIS